MDLVEFFKSGGPFMYAILLVMCVGLAIAIERFFFITKMQSKTNLIWKKLRPMLQAEDFDRAYREIKNNQSPLSTVLEYGFARYQKNRKREIIDSAMEEGILEVTPDLQQRTHYLATLANIATLLGLLGTIIGLIQAFTAVASADPAEKADLLSASISIAMNTTAFGLSAAIPLILIHSYIATRTSRLVDNLEMAAVKCLNLICDE